VILWIQIRLKKTLCGHLWSHQANMWSDQNKLIISLQQTPDRENKPTRALLGLVTVTSFIRRTCDWRNPIAVLCTVMYYYQHSQNMCNNTWTNTCRVYVHVMIPRGFFFSAYMPTLSRIDYENSYNMYINATWWWMTLPMGVVVDGGVYKVWFCILMWFQL